MLKFRWEGLIKYGVLRFTFTMFSPRELASVRKIQEWFPNHL